VGVARTWTPRSRPCRICMRRRLMYIRLPAANATAAKARTWPAREVRCGAMQPPSGGARVGGEVSAPTGMGWGGCGSAAAEDRCQQGVVGAGDREMAGSGGGR